MKDKIFIKQWLALKPYVNQTATDSYYLSLSNKIKKVLNAPDCFILLMYINKEEIDLLSCFLASYFEDIISETNIWNAFTATHFEHYGKMLPFYDTKEYYKGEVNVQDITFLIWHFLNTAQDKKFISPYNDFIIDIAEKVAIILDEAYEYAPENDHLKSFYTIAENETDYYLVRKVVDNVLFKTYLFYTDTALKLAEQETELIEEYKDKNVIHYLQETRDSLLHQSHTRLMSLKGKEWTAKILGDNHPISADLLNLSKRISGYFFYKGQNEADIFIEHIASGKKFKLTKKSFDHYNELKETDTIMFMGIVKWKNEWWFSGIYVQTEFNADLVLDEKNSVESRMKVNFIDHNKQETRDILKKQFEVFKAFNNDSQIAFMPASAIEPYVNKYMEFYNSTLNLTANEIEQAEKRAAKEGFFGGNENHSIIGHKPDETGLVFLNPKSGVEMAFHINNAFPLKNNPYFDKNGSDEAIMALLMSDQLSTELVQYCIEHCSARLSFFKKGVGKMYLDDIDFLLRFWKRENYHSRPEITLTGSE